MSGLRVVREGSAWRALDRDVEVGRVEVQCRPDGRCFASFGSCRPDAYRPLVEAAADRDLYATVDETDSDGRRRYEGLGFVVERHEDDFRIPTDPRVTGLDGVTLPDGFATVSAPEADEDRLRILGDELVQDVPGADGWRTSAEEFRDMLGWPSFDPATYLAAVDEGTGAYAGLVRVWANRAGPRLGLIGVLAPYRRRGLARGLLAAAFGVLYGRGQPEVTAEADRSNVASVTLLGSLGAFRTGGTVELRRPAGN